MSWHGDDDGERVLIYFYHVPGTDTKSHHINPVRLIFPTKIFFPPLIGKVLIRPGTKERQMRHLEHNFKEALAVRTLRMLA